MYSQGLRGRGCVRQVFQCLFPSFGLEVNKLKSMTSYVRPLNHSFQICKSRKSAKQYLSGSLSFRLVSVETRSSKGECSTGSNNHLRSTFFGKRFSYLGLTDDFPFQSIDAEMFAYMQPEERQVKQENHESQDIMDNVNRRLQSARLFFYL